MRIAICDDDRSFLVLEQKLIEKYMHANQYEAVIDAFSSGSELLEKKEALKTYDMIFLDVDMEPLNGLDTAKQIRKIAKEVAIVLVTAYYHYAIEGYKVKAYLYILKDEATLYQTLTECFDSYIAEHNLLEDLCEFSFREGEKNLPVSSIIYVESELHYTFFYIYENGRTVRYSMKEKLSNIEEKLQGHCFCRVHKSFLVNLSYVRKLQRYRVELTNGMEVSVAQSRYMEVVKDYMDYKGDAQW